MFTRHGFSLNTVGQHSVIEVNHAGRNCIQATLSNDDDPKGRWGDSPSKRLWRAQLSSQLMTVFNRREEICFSTCIPADWKVAESGAFRWDGTQNEQCVLFGMHSNGPESAELSLSVVGDRLVWWYHNRPVWQGRFIPEQWDDWKLDVKWHNSKDAGTIHILRNGVEVFGEQWSATLLRPDQANYLKIGLYLWGKWPDGIDYRRAFFIV